MAWRKPPYLVVCWSFASPAVLLALSLVQKPSGFDYAVIYTTQPQIDISGTEFSTSIRSHSRGTSHPRTPCNATVVHATILQGATVLSGWRPETAQHRGAQKPLQELSVQVERFRKQSPPSAWVAKICVQCTSYSRWICFRPTFGCLWGEQC